MYETHKCIVSTKYRYIVRSTKYRYIVRSAGSTVHPVATGTSRL